MTKDHRFWSLTWDELDPARNAFDAATVVEVVSALEPFRHPPRANQRSDADRMARRMNQEAASSWASAVSYLLMEHYGRWAVGWGWSPSPGDYEGPFRNWESTLANLDGAPAFVAAGLREWRGWTEELDRWFDAHPRVPGPVDAHTRWWRDTSRDLILFVAERTECYSSWYAECNLILTWFLQRWGVDAELAAHLVEKATDGRFESWTGPDAVLDDVTTQLARSVPGPGEAQVIQVPPDHLREWLSIRETVEWAKFLRDDNVRWDGPFRDGAADDIRDFDGSIDPARGRAMLAALEMVRVDAAQGTPLDFAVLQRWQRRVLDRPDVAFRMQPAFAKSGRERYGIGPDTRERLDACLAQAGREDSSLPVEARAARAYLDVCFFHPFDDGNARSAFLTLVCVLAGEGANLNRVTLVRRVSHDVHDARGAAYLSSSIRFSLNATS